MDEENLGTRAKAMLEIVKDLPEKTEAEKQAEEAKRIAASKPLLCIKLVGGHNHQIEFITATYTYDEAFKILARGGQNVQVECVDELGGRVVGFIKDCSQIFGALILDVNSIRTAQRQAAALQAAAAQRDGMTPRNPTVM